VSPACHGFFALAGIALRSDGEAMTATGVLKLGAFKFFIAGHTGMDRYRNKDPSFTFIIYVGMCFFLFSAIREGLSHG